MATIAILIVAGGSGTRMGGETPKQFLPLAGEPLLMHTIRRFSEALPDAVRVVVLPGQHIARWEALCREYGFTIAHTVTHGGQTRFDSVRNGLKAAPPCQMIGVHDGVRPLIDKELIFRVLNVAEKSGAAIPVVPVTDSLREIPANRAVDRSRYVAVQTPQFFRSSLLIKAYERGNAGFTDDASVVESSGISVTLVPGEPNNIKVTTPVDLAVAEALLK